MANDIAHDGRDRDQDERTINAEIFDDIDGFDEVHPQDEIDDRLRPVERDQK
jgi:hypothetical protein